MLHIPPTNLLLLAAKQEPYKKSYLFMKNIEEFSGKSSEKRTSRKSSDRKGNRTREKNKRGDSKVESNDSPETPDRGETSDKSTRLQCDTSGDECLHLDWGKR